VIGAVGVLDIGSAGGPWWQKLKLFSTESAGQFEQHLNTIRPLGMVLSRKVL
jgi:hypothetical protein